LSAFGKGFAATMQSGWGNSFGLVSQQQFSIPLWHFPLSATKSMLKVQKFRVTAAVGRMKVIKAKSMEARNRIRC
jgi:hypothetical protein